MNLPTLPVLDRSVDFLRSGYLFASRMRAAAGMNPESSTPVEFPLLGAKTLLIRGEDAVDFFYDQNRIKRDGAMPLPVRGPLFGAGAVHGLDGRAHEVRKQAMADLAYDDSQVARFASLVEEELEALLGRWSEDGTGTVYEGATLAYGRAAFRWAGLRMTDAEADRRSRQMAHLLDTFGDPLRHALAWIERGRLDRWATGLIADVRAGRLEAEAGTPLAEMARLRDENGSEVDARTAAVELQNLTRPTVAVARFAAFAATALVEHPEWAERIRSASAEGERLLDVPEAVAFAQEVRRVYPFVPMLPGLATQDTEFRGCPVHKGQRVMIDILGTNTDPESWRDAKTFDPGRFLDVEDAEQIRAFIPQGGAEVRSGHRCPGEKIAVTALSATVVALCRPGVSVSTDPDDTTFPWTTMLTRPATGVRVTVRR